MTKEHAYAYEAGYKDGATNYELNHCPSCPNLVSLQEALDENAKLRKLANRMLGSIRRFEMCSDSYSVSSEYEQWMRLLGMEIN